jgi:hypothetical protein
MPFQQKLKVGIESITLTFEEMEVEDLVKMGLRLLKG